MASRAEGIHPPMGEPRTFSRREVFSYRNSEGPKKTTGGDDSGKNFLNSLEISRRDAVRALVASGIMWVVPGAGIASYASNELGNLREDVDTLQLNEVQNNQEIEKKKAQIDNHNVVFGVGAGMIGIGLIEFAIAKSINNGSNEDANQVTATLTEGQNHPPS